MFYCKSNISSEIDWLKDHTYSIQLHELEFRFVFFKTFTT